MAETATKTTPHRNHLMGQRSWAIGVPKAQAQSETLYKDYSWSDSVTGVREPAYKRLIAQKSNATTSRNGVLQTIVSRPVSGELEFWTHPTSTNTAYYRWYRVGGYEPQVLPNFSPPSLPVTGAGVQSADNQAIANLYKRLIGIETSVQSGEDFGEIGQTIRMLKRPLQSLTKFSTELATGQLRAVSIKNSAKAAKALADTTLEYRFGIKPLCSTVAEALVGLQNRDNVFKAHPFSAKGMSSQKSVSPPTDFSANGSLNYVQTITQTQEVRYKGEWICRSDLPKRSVESVLGLRWKDVIPTLYNLAPYSWLLDYFTNVGDIVNSIAVPWSDVAWCCKTTRHHYKLRIEFVGWALNGTIYRTKPQFSPGFTEITKTAFDRRAQSGLPYPKLELRVPNAKQVQNIVALAVSRLAPMLTKFPDAIRSRPNLQSAFADEIGRRGTRIPYPFHLAP